MISTHGLLNIQHYELVKVCKEMVNYFPPYLHFCSQTRGSWMQIHPLLFPLSQLAHGKPFSQGTDQPKRKNSPQSALGRRPHGNAFFIC